MKKYLCDKHGQLSKRNQLAVILIGPLVKTWCRSCIDKMMGNCCTEILPPKYKLINTGEKKVRKRSARPKCPTCSSRFYNDEEGPTSEIERAFGKRDHNGTHYKCCDACSGQLG
jgi:hypothetical protein